MVELKVLIIDPIAASRELLATTAAKGGFISQCAADAAAGLEQLTNNEIDLVLLDLAAKDLTALKFIERAKEVSAAPIILLAGAGEEELALSAIHHGAHDYLSKPIEPNTTISAIKKCCEREHLSARAENKQGSRKFSFSNIVAENPKMLEIFETVKRLANFKTTILISGESGTGKELIARAIHYSSTRAAKPFVAVNCGAIPENLMESEFFGHKKGSFTDAIRDKIGLFEEAHGGTIFLDEIGDMPLHLQVKLLRALQEQRIRRVGDESSIPVDVRVLAASNRDLEDDVMTGRFRDDLFYRLNVVSIHIPALRERQEDIPALIRYFLKRNNKKLGLSIKGLDDASMQALKNYSWRGNIRELENCLERAMVLTDGDTITKEVLPSQITESNPGASSKESTEEVGNDNLSVKQRVKALETNLILRALKQTDGNRTHAAKLLEISHRTLLYKLKEYGLS